MLYTGKPFQTGRPAVGPRSGVAQPRRAAVASTANSRVLTSPTPLVSGTARRTSAELASNRGGVTASSSPAKLPQGYVGGVLSQSSRPPVPRFQNRPIKTNKCATCS